MKLGGGWAAECAVFERVFPERYLDPGLCDCYLLDQRGLCRLEEPGVSRFLGVFIDKELIKKRFKSLPPKSTAQFGA